MSPSMCPVAMAEAFAVVKVGKQRVAVALDYAFARDRGHRGRGGFVDHAETQSVGDEQNHIMGLSRWLFARQPVT